METSYSTSYSVIAASGIIISMILLIVGFRLARWKKIGTIGFAGILLIPSALFLVALNPWMVDSRYRTYRSFYRDLDAGMTKDEVWKLVDLHYPANGKRKAPTVLMETSGSLDFFMNPEHTTNPNCEGIFITFQDGKLTSKGYSND